MASKLGVSTVILHMSYDVRAVPDGGTHFEDFTKISRSEQHGRRRKIKYLSSNF